LPTILQSRLSEQQIAASNAQAIASISAQQAQAIAALNTQAARTQANAKAQSSTISDIGGLASIAGDIFGGGGLADVASSVLGFL
jgi:hypothetical protein